MLKDCFVIMPFSETVPVRNSDYWTGHFDNFLKPSLEKHGYRVYRSEAKTGKISADIVRELAFCDLVFAVLTDNNPNVWYELGVRHTSRLGTILAIQDGQRPAFDVQDYGIIFYQDHDLPGFERKLENHVNSLGQRDSPVADFLKIDLNVAVNTAISTLRKAVRITSEVGSDVALLGDRLREFQATLPPSAQVSVVKDRRWIYQRDVDIGSDPFQCWHDVTKP